MTRGLLIAAAAVLTVSLAACAGGAGGARTVAVRMTDDMRYDPAEYDFFAGQTVRFEVTNAGSLRHEFFVGDVAAHEEHAEEMRSMAGSEMGHDEPTGVSVEPGQTELIEITFDAAGNLMAGCHEPGHFEAGMSAPIVIHPAS